MKGPFNVDNPITSMVNRFKMWAIIFCKNNIRAENKDPRLYV